MLTTRPQWRSSGMYCRVKWLSTDVSEVRTASLIPDDGRPWWWRQYIPLKRRSTIILHGSTSQKTILNILTGNHTTDSSCPNFVSLHRTRQRCTFCLVFKSSSMNFVGCLEFKYAYILLTFSAVLTYGSGRFFHPRWDRVLFPLNCFELWILCR
jgi:hypothetical protein